MSKNKRHKDTSKKHRRPRSVVRHLPSPRAKYWSVYADECLEDKVISLIDKLSQRLNISDWRFVVEVNPKLIKSKTHIACEVEVLGPQSASLSLNPEAYKVMKDRNWSLRSVVAHELVHCVLDHSFTYLNNEIEDIFSPRRSKKDKIDDVLDETEESIVNLVTAIIMRGK